MLFADENKNNRKNCSSQEHLVGLFLRTGCIKCRSIWRSVVNLQIEYYIMEIFISVFEKSEFQFLLFHTFKLLPTDKLCNTVICYIQIISCQFFCKKRINFFIVTKKWFNTLIWKQFNDKKMPKTNKHCKTANILIFFFKNQNFWGIKNCFYFKKLWNELLRVFETSFVQSRSFSVPLSISIEFLANLGFRGDWKTCLLFCLYFDVTRFILGQNDKTIFINVVVLFRKTCCRT